MITVKRPATGCCFGDEPLTYKPVPAVGTPYTAMVVCPKRHIIHLHPHHPINKAGSARGVTCLFLGGCNFEDDIRLAGWAA